MKIETIYKGTCVLLGICFITMIGYNVGVSKGEETDTTKDEIPDWWELTKPKVESIELEYWRCGGGCNPGLPCTYWVNITNTLDFPILIRCREYGEYSPIWFLNTTGGYQYRPYDVHVLTETWGNLKGDGYVYSIQPNSTVTVSMVFIGYSDRITHDTIYYEAYIESEHTIVKGVCEISNITP